MTADECGVRISSHADTSENATKGNRMKTFRLWSLVGVLLVLSLSAAGAAASPSRPAADPSDCTHWEKGCEWIASPGRFAYCKYDSDGGSPTGQHRMLCVSPVSGNWVRMALGTYRNHSSYGRDPRFLGFRRRAEIVRGEWLSDRPSDAVAQCRANVHFFYCSLNDEMAVWFKPDGSFALLRATKHGWKLEARG